ncbi:MAG: hypothetical protein LKG14_04445 [Prevotella sp.]|uniref:PepSY domain-containing protein n=1 Tax=Segatella cerevisiae TaxID=2053716 RepID=A0ABT1C0F4_9BACT|nr:hypothetical protein [Segatella cerevisiae]MCH3994182.1 hypothetical protein [Prevotella sp.]MCI1246619.1 hypothetical protein [Prevotella sp.]MCO6026192.1 hypothetical protein [Segatella cerevisiae]
MKKLFVLVAMLSMSFAAFAQVEGTDSAKTDTVSTSAQTEQPATAPAASSDSKTLPQAITDYITKNYPGATVSDFTKADENGATIYSVKIQTKDNAVFTEKYKENGEVVQ